MNGSACRLRDINELFMIPESARKAILLSDRVRLTEF